MSSDLSPRLKQAHADMLATSDRALQGFGARHTSTYGLQIENLVDLKDKFATLRTELGF